VTVEGGQIDRFVGAKDEAVCFNADKIDPRSRDQPNVWFGSGSAALMVNASAFRD
jgi:hypothetical protein